MRVEKCLGSIVQGLFLVILFLSCNPGENRSETTPITDNIKLFELLSPDETGIRFKNVIRESGKMNGLLFEYFYNGGGVAIGDLNNDGLSDIYFTANMSSNKLYINQGDLKFQDVTIPAGLKDSPSWSTGVTMADVNGDGFLDIYVCRSGQLSKEQRTNQLFISQGTDDKGIPHFREMAKQYGLDNDGYSTQALFFDFDRDNDLDMFLINYNVDTRLVYEFDRSVRSNLVSDRLYRNDDGIFTDISEEAGIYGHEIGFGLGVAAGDLNNDGWPDLYISNDYNEYDYVYINQKDGTFKESSKDMLNHMSYFSMGLDIADVNNDGYNDIFSLDMSGESNYSSKASMSGMNPERFWSAVDHGFQYQYMYNALQLNNGKGNFSDIANMAGVSSTDWSWSVLLEDFDNDGWKDAYISNGLKRDFRNNDFVRYKKKVMDGSHGQKSVNRDSLFLSLLQKMPERPAVDHIYRNNGDLTFTKENSSWGITIPTFTNGISVADLDNDGDLDIVTNNIDQNAFVYKNNASFMKKNNYLGIKLIGPEGNNNGVGAKVTVILGNGLTQTKENFLSRGYQSSVGPIIQFGLGRQENVDTLVVQWPDGKIQSLNKIKVNRLLTVDYKNAIAKNTYHKEYNQELPITDIDNDAVNLKYVHAENDFNDFDREVLLPHRMSRFGPALSISDVNGDGYDDVFVGGASGFSGKLYVQDSISRFHRSMENPWHLDKNFEDVSSTFFDADGDGDDDLYVVSGGNEHIKGSEYYRDRLYVNNGDGQFKLNKLALPDIRISGSRVRTADFDNDGDLDVFVGGRQIPGLYPNTATSVLLRNDGDGSTLSFTDITNEMLPELVDIGMVTDGVWTDINEDKKLDLVVVGEWMAVRVFINRGATFEEQSEEWGTLAHRGWWNTIVSEDFDNDGDMDLIAGNLGLNYKYKASQEEPFELYAGDFDKNGTQDIALGYYQGGVLYPLRGRECSSQQIPSIKERFPSYDMFARASFEEVYGEGSSEGAKHFVASTFATTYFENTENGFIPHILNNMAQMSSTNVILIEDYNNDGKIDLLLAGNLYSSEVETPRNDASYGLVLTGDGKGNFKPITVEESGLFVRGEIREAAFLTLANGKKALLFARNSDMVRIVAINKKPSN